MSKQIQKIILKKLTLSLKRFKRKINNTYNTQIVVVVVIAIR